MNSFLKENCKQLENWIEQDLNPFMTFSSSGKIGYTNNEAQFLLNRIPCKQLFDIAMQYAPITFGFDTSYIDLSLGNYKFYAVTVGYSDEENISLKLYKSITTKKENIFQNNSGEMVNIFTLLDLSISTNSIKPSNLKTKFIKKYDPSIPEFKIIINEFLKLVNLIYERFSGSSNITTTVKLKVGEFIKINNKKYSLISVEIKGDKFNKHSDTSIEDNAYKISIIESIDNHHINLNLPLYIE